MRDAAFVADVEYVVDVPYYLDTNVLLDPDALDAAVQRNVRLLRALRGATDPVTTVELCRRGGYRSRQAVEARLTGTTRLLLEDIGRLAAALDVEPGVLLLPTEVQVAVWVHEHPDYHGPDLTRSYKALTDASSLGYMASTTPPATEAEADEADRRAHAQRPTPSTDAMRSSPPGGPGRPRQIGGGSSTDIDTSDAGGPQPSSSSSSSSAPTKRKRGPSPGSTASTRPTRTSRASRQASSSDDT